MPIAIVGMVVAVPIIVVFVNFMVSRVQQRTTKAPIDTSLEKSMPKPVALPQPAGSDAIMEA